MKKTWKLVGPNGQIYESIVPGTLGGWRKGKIYGQLNCPSALRHLAKGHYAQERVFFLHAADAIAAGYRPCGKCMKEDYDRWKRAEHA